MSDEDDLIRFPCDNCGKLLGAFPQMRSVVCAKCNHSTEVPTPTYGKAPMDPFDGSLFKCAWRGIKITVMLAPLIVLIAAAVLGVIWVSKLLHELETP